MHTQHTSQMDTILPHIRQAEERARQDSARPMYHFRPPAQWMNDPNGTIYHNGYYHVFYQFNPYNDDWGTIHWGHARSRDLVDWEHLPVALFPSNEHEEAHCASGCAVITEAGTPMIFYTNFTHALEERPYDQRAAFGDADLIQWRKYPANPILDVADPGHPPFKATWRDPFIFREGGRTFLILGAETANDWVIPVYEARNADLLSWMYCGNLYELPKHTRSTIFLFECPNLVKVGGKWVLLYSPMGGGVEYKIGVFDPDSLRFIPGASGIFDPGYRELTGFYASNTLTDDRGRCVVFGWIRGFAPGRGWNGCLALPRVLTLDDDGGLRQRPVPELRTLRGAHTRLEAQDLHNSRHRIDSEQGRQIEILVRFRPSDAHTFGVRVCCAGDGSFAVPICYDGQELHVADVRVLCALPDDDPALTLHIFLDRSVLEVFVNDGRMCVTRILEVPPDAQGIEVFAQGGTVTLYALDIWSVNAIW